MSFVVAKRFLQLSKKESVVHWTIVFINDTELIRQFYVAFPGGEPQILAQ